MCIIDLLKISPSEASKIPHGDLCSIGFANIFQQPKLFTFANNRFSSAQFSCSVVSDSLWTTSYFIARKV